jgi:hypothetical protein
MYQNTAIFYGFFYNGAADAVRRCEFITSLLENQPARIIDMSAGVGDIAFNLAAAGHYVTCFEPCGPMFSTLLDRFKGRREIRHLVSIFPNRIDDFAVQLDADLAVASNVFSHMDDADKRSWMRAVHAQLRAGGKFVFNCVQETPLRPVQPFSEISKKVFGETAIRHFASSTPVEDGAKQSIRFEYRMEFRGKTVCTVADDFTLYMDTPESMTADMEEAGFRDVRLFGSYEGIPPNPDLPGFVIVASKA